MAKKISSTQPCGRNSIIQNGAFLKCFSIAFRKIYMVTLYPFTTDQPKLSKPWIIRLERKINIFKEIAVLRACARKVSDWQWARQGRF